MLRGLQHCAEGRCWWNHNSTIIINCLCTWCHTSLYTIEAHTISACDFTSGNVLGSLGPGNMAACGLSCRKPLVSTGWAISLLLCTNGLRKWSSGRVGPQFLAVKLFSRSLGPRAVPIESLLDSRCDLSHECAQDGWNDTCVKLEASKPTWSGNMALLGDL